MTDDVSKYDTTGLLFCDLQTYHVVSDNLQLLFKFNYLADNKQSKHTYTRLNAAHIYIINTPMSNMLPVVDKICDALNF